MINYGMRGCVLFDNIKSVVKFSGAQHLHNDLIRLFLSLSFKSSIAYISSLIFFDIVFYEFIPIELLIIVSILHIINQLMRWYYVHLYKDKKLNKKQKNIFLRNHTLLIFMGGVVWGVCGALSVVYAPSPYEYVMVVLLVAMSAGSIATLNAIYRTYLAFNVPLFLILVGALLFTGTITHILIAIILMIFTYVVIQASWDMYHGLKRSIELKHLYHYAQEELKELNENLEDVISEKVAENRQKDQQMIEQSRLAQMGEMISMIAHQWRQPLSAITATTGAMTLHLHLEELSVDEMQENINKINTYTQYLSATITDFRNFFKPDKEKSLISMNDVVHGSLQIIGSSLEAQNIILESSLESEQKFKSYPNELKQVVLNILKNAQDVLLEKEVPNGRIFIKAETQEGNFKLSIYDNAGGISEEHLPYVFDSYFTTKEKRDGTGLGLYMSKMIVEDHCKGTLDVENTDDGACFTLTIPRELS